VELNVEHVYNKIFHRLISIKKKRNSYFLLKLNLKTSDIDIYSDNNKMFIGTYVAEIMSSRNKC
jgi:hypothetical protein